MKKKKKEKFDKAVQFSLFVLILMIVIGGLTVYYGLKSTNSNKPVITDTLAMTSNPDTVASSLVCMVNDQFMGRQQIPVIVNSKVYYGCCQGCVDKIKNNVGNVRYAKDPLTGERVDKAEAYIVLQTNGNGLVWYFKSRNNYLKFKKRKS